MMRKLQFAGLLIALGLSATLAMPAFAQGPRANWAQNRQDNKPPKQQNQPQRQQRPRQRQRQEQKRDNRQQRQEIRRAQNERQSSGANRPPGSNPNPADAMGTRSINAKRMC